jgi:hypothetical protein
VEQADPSRPQLGRDGASDRIALGECGFSPASFRIGSDAIAQRQRGGPPSTSRACAKRPNRSTVA